MAGCPKLTILSQQLRGKTFELTKDLYTIGRIEERDICIEDPTISTYHGSLVKNGTSYILKDNNSTNGTRVNNVPISEQELQNSDIIQLGDVELLYDCDSGEEQSQTRTITQFNFDRSNSSSSSISKMDTITPFDKQKKDGRKTQKAILITMGALGLIILVLLGVVGYFVFAK